MTNGATQYGTILADPPWDVPSQRGTYGAGRHYPLMTIEQISALRASATWPLTMPTSGCG